MTDPAGDRLDRIIDWFADHVVDEVNFEGLTPLVIVDAAAAAEAADRVHPSGNAWTWVNTGGLSAMAIECAPHGDRPWVTVLRGDDGPLHEIFIVPDDYDYPGSATESMIGTIEVPSGRVALGSPDSLRLRADTLRRWTAEEGTCELLMDDLDDPRLREFDGAWNRTWVLVAQLSAPGVITVSAAIDPAHRLLRSVVLELPQPVWVRRQREIEE